MTTYTISAIQAIFQDVLLTNFAAPSVIEIVGPDSFNTLRYQIDETFPDGFSDTTIVDFDGAHEIRVDGVLQSNLWMAADAYTTSITWGPGNVSHVFGFSVDINSTETVDYLVLAGGTPLPVITNVRQMNAFLQSVTNLDGPLPGLIGPNLNIPIENLPGVAMTHDDLMNGTVDADSFNGGQGFDTMHGEEGSDNLSGGRGNDRLFGDIGNDTLIGEKGRDSLHGGDDNDDIRGGDDGDFLYGDFGFDVLLGGTGNDLLRGGGQQDTLFGGTGDDTLSGGKGGDRLTGDDGNDTLYGGQGWDNLSGGTGNDALFGGSANDTLDGGSGNDMLQGDTGADEFQFSQGYDLDIVIDFQDGIDSISFDRNLWGGAMKTGQQIVDDHAMLSVGDAVFDFGSGDVFMIKNVAVLNDLYDDVNGALIV